MDESAKKSCSRLVTVILGVNNSYFIVTASGCELTATECNYWSVLG